MPLSLFATARRHWTWPRGAIERHRQFSREARLHRAKKNEGQRTLGRSAAILAEEPEPLWLAALLPRVPEALDVVSVCTRPGQHVTDRIGPYQPQVPGAEFGLGVRWRLALPSIGVPGPSLGNPPMVVFSLGLGGVPEGSPVAGQLSGTLAGAAAGAAAGGNLVATPGVCACGAWSGAHRGGKTRRSPGCDLCLCDRCMHNRSLTGRTRPGATTQVMWE